VKVAVTGGTGFVGSHLVEALRARGDDVRCLMRAPRAAASLTGLGAQVVAGALDDARALDALCEGADVVYHVAGLIAAPSEEAFARVNREGTAAVAGAARRAGAGRVLYVSTLAVTGPTVPGRPLDESGPPRPVTAYGRSKGAGEDVLRADGVPFTIVRPPIVFGPRDRQVLRLFRAARWRVLPVLAGGFQELSMVYAPELAQALIAAATSEKTRGGTYHAAHPEPITQREWARQIAAAMGVTPRLVSIPPTALRGVLRVTGTMARLKGQASLLDANKADELLAPAWTCDSTALLRDAGWRATRPHPDAFAETARWYRNAGWV
jgi:nucleoside-diphosphate-sugar epimerase